ncbi:hypothetical protein DSUL_50027 [Desulfovibrionales bacterium]
MRPYWTTSFIKILWRPTSFRAAISCKVADPNGLASLKIPLPQLLYSSNRHCSVYNPPALLLQHNNNIYKLVRNAENIVNCLHLLRTTALLKFFTFNIGFFSFSGKRYIS